MYKLSEIFYSIQGEGYHAGVPMIFVRFEGCNQHCWFCDTDPAVRLTSSSADLLERLRSYPRCHTLCLTGGEPLLQVDRELVSQLTQEGYTLHLETNGTLEPSFCFPGWITCSPKIWPLTLKRYNELKWLVGDGKDLWRHSLEEGPFAAYEYLQPVWAEDWKQTTQQAIQLVKKYPRFRLGVQLHQLLNVFFNVK